MKPKKRFIVIISIGAGIVYGIVARLLFSGVFEDNFGVMIFGVMTVSIKHKNHQIKANQKIKA